MGKNARDQIPPPVLQQPDERPQRDTVAIAAPLPPDVARDLQNPPGAAGYTPVVSELAARAITGAAGMAREYAAAAGELCRTADHNPQARNNARRLLRLALAHLEA